ncbi:Protein arginine N-methyltransferase 5, variant 2 [Balamuthia mandrillaris]
MMEEHLTCGLELTCVPDLVERLQEARQQGYDYVACPLAHPRYHRSFLQESRIQREEPWTRSDMLLSSYQWSSGVIGKTSPWINLDSDNRSVQLRSAKAFKQEIAWATHLSLSAVLLPVPSFHSTNYAHTINQTVLNLNYMQVWLKIPLTSPELMLEDEDEEGSSNVNRVSASGRSETDTWEWWNSVRSLCEHHSNLYAVLEMTPDLPPASKLKRWFGEPVKAIILPTNVFLTNKMGYPTLSKNHQQFLCAMFRHKVQVIIRGVCKHKEGLGAYQQYVRYLHKKLPPLTEQELFEAPYLDYLQAPLQPLMDDLESQTYETFERDPIKYREYERAVYHALLKREEGSTTVLMVVGAGRGPLVRASLRAAKSANRKLRVYAVEKNVNAVVTLRNLKISQNWGDMVTIVNTDMRVWDAPEKADILVSELLGSFGDNELSPECLDGAQKFLKMDGGISIPSAYTSFVAPICSSKLYNEVKAYNDRKHFETAYVVKLHNVDQLAPSKPCFTFVHPNREKNIDNSRYTKLSWQIENSSTLHGFAGYFDAQLFEDVHISINPDTFSEGMFSWFPLFFPLRVRLLLLVFLWFYSLPSSLLLFCA